MRQLAPKSFTQVLIKINLNNNLIDPTVVLMAKGKYNVVNLIGNIHINTTNLLFC